MRAAAIVINHNGGQDLPRCLAALTEQTEPVQVVLVDCASTDGSEKLAQTPPEGVVGLPLAENVGYTGGANAGLALLSHQVAVVGFFNPDCIPAPDFFSHCLELFQQNPRLGGVAPRLVRPDGQTLDSCGQVLSRWVLRVQDLGYNQRAEGEFLCPARVLAACGAGMVYRREALAAAAVGGKVFPSEFFAFWEDMDLGWRVNNAGFEVWYWPSVQAVHRRGGTAAPGRGRLMLRRPAPVAFGIFVNRWACLVRNLHWRDFLWRLPLLVVWDAALLSWLLWQKPAVVRCFFRFPQRMAAAWRQRRQLSQRPLRELLP